MSTRRRPAAIDLVPLVRRFESSIPQVARDITDRIWQEIPAYASLADIADRAQVEEAAHRNVAAFVRALGEGRELSRRDIDALGAVGGQRAQQAIPLEDVLRAFRMVGRVLWDHLAEQMTGDDAPPMDVVIELGGTLMSFTDQISSAVAHHYSVAQRSIVRQQEAGRREFLHDLLSGSRMSPDQMLQRARGFGYDLARPQIAVVAEAADAVDGQVEESLMTRAMETISELWPMSGQPMVERRSGQTVGLFSISSAERTTLEPIGQKLHSSIGERYRLGLGGPYQGPEGVRRSYLEAKEALEIGAILEPERCVYPFESFLLYRFLRTDADLVARFITSVLGPVIDHDSRRKSELVKTLDAYFVTDGSAKDAGKVLYAHPHTVTYRLKQIERLTSRSLRDPEDKLHLHLAVKALRLSRGTTYDHGKDEPDQTAS